MAVVSFFVSSTFSDFNIERDLLQGPVLDELNERARPLGGSVEIIDLRWGLTTHGLTSEEVHRKVLGVCLNEIERCKPCFISLLGQRFGWVPDQSTLDEQFDRYTADGVDLAPLRQMPAGQSITSIEHEFGLLGIDGPDAVVFLREPIERPPTDWVDEDLGAIEELRSRVADKLPANRRNTYRARPDDSSWPRDFGALAVDALWPVVQGRLLEHVPTSGATRNVIWDAFLDAERSDFVGRRDLISRAVQETQVSSGVVLLGESGVGKSALWARVLDSARGRFARTTASSVGLLASESTPAGVAVSLSEQLGVALLDSTGVSAVEHWVSVALSSEEPTLVAIDALDQLGAIAADRNPIEVASAIAGSGNVALLVSTTSPDHARTLQSLGLSVIEVGELEPTEAADMAAKLCHPKQLPIEATLSLAARSRSPLWVSLAVRRLLMLGADDIAPAQGVADSSEALEALISQRAAEIPGEPSDVAGLLFDDCVERLTYLGLTPQRALQTARSTIANLALSRSGMRPADLVSLANEQDGAMLIATIQRTLGRFLRSGGANGEIDFAHNILRDAAFAWSREDALIVHERLARHLLAQPFEDPLRSTSAVWHTMRAGDGRMLARALDGLLPTIDSTWTASCSSAAEQLTEALESDDLASRSNAQAALRSIPESSAGSAALFLARTSAMRASALHSTTSDLLTVTATAWAFGAKGSQRTLEQERILLAVLSARAAVLAESRSWEEGFMVHGQADATYGRIVKLIDSKDSRIIEQVFDMQEASARMFRSRGQTFRSTGANNTVNLMVTTARSAGTFDERLGWRQADSYLDITETTLHATRYSLARSGLSAARNELIQMGEPDSADAAAARRWLRLAVAAGCIKLFEFNDPASAADTFTSAEPLLDQYLGKYPWDLHLLQLQQEFRYYQGRSAWSTEHGSVLLRRSTSTYEQILTRLRETPRSHLIASAAHLNLAELGFFRGDTDQGERELATSVRCIARTPADAIERADGLEMLRAFLRHQLEKTPPNGKSSRRWRKLVERGMSNPTVLEHEGIASWATSSLAQLLSLASDPDLPHRKPARWGFARGHALCIQ